MTKSELFQLKYGKDIYNAFQDLYEDWMNEEDKLLFLEMIAKVSNKTLIDMNNDIEIGIKNGYPLEYQMKIIKQIIETFKDKI